jgi:hypothetical protein
MKPQTVKTVVPPQRPVDFNEWIKHIQTELNNLYHDKIKAKK